MAWLTRREFVGTTTAGAATLWLGSGLLGCGDDANGAAPTGPDPLQPTCGELTEPNIEGPFFAPGSPERTSLRELGMPGVPLRLAGRVLAPDCSPLSAALLDFWQADDNGVYDNTGFTLRGHQYTGADGAYVLEAIVPGHYPNGATFRPAHLHVKAGAQGFKLLTTQLYFEGDPYNGTDPFIRPSLIMSLTDGTDGVKLATFDFVLTPA